MADSRDEIGYVQGKPKGKHTVMPESKEVL